MKKYIVWCEDLELGFTTSNYQLALDIKNNNTDCIIDESEYPGIAAMAFDFCDLTEDSELIIIEVK